MFEIIDDLKKKLDQYRPLSPAMALLHKYVSI